MYIEDDGAPRGAVEEARLEGDTVTRGVVHEDKAVSLPSEPARAEACGVPSPEVQPPVDAPELSPTSSGLGRIEQTDKVAFFDQIEKVSDLGKRAFLLRCGGFKPYDERTRRLISSVAEEGPTGAVVQGLLHTPQPMPASIMKPVRLPRASKLKPVKPSKSLIDTLLGQDDEAA
jgi:hypothetical protein